MEEKLSFKDYLGLIFCAVVSSFITFSWIVSLGNLGNELCVKMPIICLIIFGLSMGISRVLWMIEYGILMGMLKTYNKLVQEFAKAKEVFTQYQTSVIGERTIYDTQFSNKDNADSFTALYRLSQSVIDMVNMYSGLDSAYKYLEDYKKKIEEKIEIINYRYPFNEIKIDELSNNEIENNID